MIIFAEYPVHAKGDLAPTEATTMAEAFRRAKIAGIELGTTTTVRNGREGYLATDGRFFLCFHCNSPADTAKMLETLAETKDAEQIVEKMFRSLT